MRRCGSTMRMSWSTTSWIGRVSWPGFVALGGRMRHSREPTSRMFVKLAFGLEYPQGNIADLHIADVVRALEK